MSGAYTSRSVGEKKYSTKPHIVFILADDLGWGDVSFLGSPQIPTPNMDALASTGVLLNNYYVTPLCSPSRGALMSGRYSIHIGLQNGVLYPAQVGGLPLQQKLMPEYFKNLGYETHIVGKWHIGYSSLKYTPTYRGFDSFLGFYTGPIDYYSHFMNYPLFLYLAHQAPHTKGGPEPLQAPAKNVAKFSYIGDHYRTIYAGMVDALDQSVGAVLEALEAALMLDDTIIVFSSDNGAAVFDSAMVNLGSNWPLRGAKTTLWEGGVRSAAFMWTRRLLPHRRVSHQLMHITDWLPTLYSAAGGDVNDLGSLDGFDMWDALNVGAPSPRTEILLNINQARGNAALRYRGFKLLVGNLSDVNERYERIGGSRPCEDLDELLRQSRAAAVLRRLYNRDVFKHGGYWRNEATVKCQGVSSSNFVSGRSYYLYDITKDPCELHDISQERPWLVAMLMDKLAAYNKTVAPPVDTTTDPRGYPEYNDGTWAPWI
ncbi:arylsulfatase B-like [Dermacentor variabilis]|uniref:arylsulfatase B-like n=1 Tax=Dermacentor variabilis TaxID=34621 RepID=UPI003F5CBC14